MKILFTTLLLFALSGCNFNVKVTKQYQKYFDDDTYKILQDGISAYQQQQYLKADSLLTYVIENSKERLSMTMPEELNPYFYRGNNSMELDKYHQAIADFEQVASDTTTNKGILLVRSEAYKMVENYDEAISICNRLLSLKSDSMMILSQRGVCYYLKGQMDSACQDLTKSKQLGGDTSYLNKFLVKCE